MGNHYIITDCYFSDNSRINTHPHAISDYGRTFLLPLLSVRLLHFMNATICSSLYFTIYSNIPRVSYIERPTYVRTGMNLASIRNSDRIYNFLRIHINGLNEHGIFYIIYKSIDI